MICIPLSTMLGFSYEWEHLFMSLARNSLCLSMLVLLTQHCRFVSQ